MKFAWMLLLSALVASASAGQDLLDRNVRVASGRPGKTYHNVYAANLHRMLAEFDVRYVLSAGSRENLQLLADDKADLGFVQADVWAGALREDPDRYGDLVLIGRLADECVYMARRQDGPVQRLQALKSPVEGRATRIAVGDREGGAHATWRFFSKLDPGYEAVEVEHAGGTLALNQLGTGRFDAVMWVTDPKNLEHKMLAGVRANDVLELMPVDDPGLDHALPDGMRIYERRTVRTSGGFFNSGLFASKIDTLCTSALMLARNDLNPMLLQRVTDLLSLERDQIVRTP